uniref:R.Pab1 family restriction endonuclease n=1 Tax=Campylobacter sp. TaxID=205 RepID=UPI0025C10F13
YAYLLPYYFGNLEIFIDNEKFLKIENEFLNFFYKKKYDENKIKNYFYTLFNFRLKRRIMTNFKIDYEIPLTSVAGKIRIKQRDTFKNYGLPIAPTKVKIDINHYIEWQIGYDEITTENGNFIGANGKKKKIYELSEIILSFFKNNIISKNELNSIKNFLESNDDFIENKMRINRANFMPTTIAKVNFLESYVSYPLLVHQYQCSNFISEIIIKEKQRAIGIQGMLYFCFPVYILKDAYGERNFLNRLIKSKEKGYLEINKNNIYIFLDMLKIFGILSKNHKYDVLQILNYILNDDLPSSN